MKKIIALATGNKHKLDEIRAILEPLDYTILSADDCGGLPEIVEDGDTFEANALKKARACAKAWNRTVLADDSGLQVLALHGEPGVYSARYAGEGGNDGRNLAKLLKNMDGIADRRARFVTVLAVVTPEGIEKTAEGVVNGVMTTEKRGTGGFGYDPAFIPDGYSQTFGELPPDVKNGISHRANALKNAIRLGIL